MASFLFLLKCLKLFFLEIFNIYKKVHIPLNLQLLENDHKVDKPR